MSAQQELEHLKQYVKQANANTSLEVEQAIDRYFTVVVLWSQLKAEWQNHMTTRERQALAEKLRTCS